MKLVKDYIFNIEYAEIIAEKNSTCKTNATKCKSSTIYETIISMCKSLFLLKYVYIIEILLAMVVLASMSDYAQNIQSPDLKAGMMVLSVLMLGVIAALAIFRNSLTLGSNVLSKNSNEFMKVFYEKLGTQPGASCPPTKPIN